MKPPNVNRPVDLGDGAPVRCHFMARDDAPRFWEECEQDATNQLEVDEIDAFNAWKAEHPHAIVMLRPGRCWLCDRHGEIVRETIEGWLA